MILLLLACTNNTKETQSIGDRLVITYEDEYWELPLIWNSAIEQGMIQSSDCEDNMGYHATWKEEGLPMFDLIYDYHLTLLGFELISHEDEPEPPWDIQIDDLAPHSMLHMFFRNNETACMIEPTTQEGSIGDQLTIGKRVFRHLELFNNLKF